MAGRRANGEGTIFQRADGRWAGATYVLMPNGGYKRKTVYGRSRADVHEKLTKLIGQTQRGVVTPTTRLTVAEYFERWLAQVVRPKLRPSTVRAYDLMVRKHIVPVIGRKRLDRLTLADVRELLNRKRAEGLSHNTVRQIHAVLRAGLEQAVRDELLVRNVARLERVGAPTLAPIEPYSEDEARKLLKTAEKDRLFALWAVALSIGLRKGEALGLRWADVDLDEGLVRVRQSLQRVSGEGLQLMPTKTNRSRRTVPLPAPCVKALKDHRRRQATERLKLGEYWTDLDLVFPTTIGTPLDPSKVNRELKALCERAKVRRIPVHGMRHTCATLLLAQGVPARVVMEILGHSQIGVTMNIYSHVAGGVQREAVQKMGSLFEPAGKAVAVKTAVKRSRKRRRKGA